MSFCVNLMRTKAVNYVAIQQHHFCDLSSTFPRNILFACEALQSTLKAQENGTKVPDRDSHDDGDQAVPFQAWCHMLLSVPSPTTSSRFALQPTIAGSLLKPPLCEVQPAFEGTQLAPSHALCQ